MRLSRYLMFGMACLSLSSCFKEEPLNAECDIEAAWVHVDSPEKVFFNLTDTLIDVSSSESDIFFVKRPEADLRAVAPVFRLTEGATITPENGSVHDFSNERVVTYTVTSQDGAWSRTYRVAFFPPEIPLVYDFEHYALNSAGKHYEWSEVGEKDRMLDIWATGNPGFGIAKGSAKPDDYPTVPLEEGFDGRGVRLTTLSTGFWGNSMKMPIAAGNLFLGRFRSEHAVTQTLKATEFGVMFNKEPLTFRGYYKYAAGPKYTDRNNKTVEGKRDKASIYSVLYRNHDDSGNAVVLHGDDVQTNPNIVAIARLDDVRETDEWTPFEVMFRYTADVDLERLRNFGYNLTIVFSSSIDGDRFEGAVGSTLCVDKVRIECKEPTEPKGEPTE